MLFPKSPAFCGKKSIVHCTSICMSSKRVSQIFKILFQTGDINIFVLYGVCFSRYVQLKSSFSDEKAQHQRHTLVEKLSKTDAAKY